MEVRAAKRDDPRARVGICLQYATDEGKGQ